MRTQGRIDLKRHNGLLAASPVGTRRSFLRHAASVGIAATLPLAAPSVVASAEPDKFKEVADGIFVRFGIQEEMSAENDGAIANIGFIVGDESIAVIDSGTDRRQGETLRRAAARTTDKPIRHLIATHVHQDHCFGHIAFSDLQLHNIGHHNLPRALAERGAYYLKELAAVSPSLADAGYIVPTETVDGTSHIDLGNRKLLLKAWPTAHTDNDLTVFDERAGFLWSGDLLFVGRLPTLDGSLTGWLSVLDDVIGPGVKQVVPGHGPVGDGRAALEAERQYLTKLRDDVRRAIDDQLDMNATLARLKDDNRQDWLLFEGNHGRNILAAYTELEWE